MEIIIVLGLLATIAILIMAASIAVAARADEQQEKDFEKWKQEHDRQDGS